MANADIEKRENSMVMQRRDRAVVRVTGADAASYLQGQVSQDIDMLAPGSSAWSLVLQPTGKLTAWFRLHRLEDDDAGPVFVIDAEPAAADTLVARLERFRLRTDVDFALEPDWEMVSVRGSADRVDDDTADVEGVELTCEFAWPGFEGVDLLGRALGPTPDVDDEAFETARIRATVPRSGIDLDEETIPAEGGAPLIETSVSFTKGCYTGQELVARIDSRGGNVPRPLRTLEADTPLAVDATITFEGAEVGRVTSAAGPLGLARVLRKVEAGAVVDVGGVTATVR